MVACNTDEYLVSYQVDCTNVALYIMLTDHSLGIGLVWIQALRNTEETRKIVGLPENYAPTAIIALGYLAKNHRSSQGKP